MTPAERRLAELQARYRPGDRYMAYELANAAALVNQERLRMAINPSIFNSPRFWGRQWGQTPLIQVYRSTAPIVGITRDPMRRIFRNGGGW